MPSPLRVLMPSIVDPAVRRGGAWTVTRGLVELLQHVGGRTDLTVLVPPEPFSRRLRQALCVAGAWVTGVPAKVRFLNQRRFRDELRRILARERFDLLVINGSDLLWCLDDAPPGLSTVTVVHNRESRLYADQVTTSVPHTLRRVLLADASRLLDFEINGLRRVQGALFLSEADAAEFLPRLPELEYLVLPPQFAEEPQRIAKTPSPWLDLGLLANFLWWPNREGARWFVRQILPHAPEDVRLHLFGEGSRAIAPHHPRVVPHGFMDDLREVWVACDWMVIPVRYGSGVSVKTAESLYHGMPILSTPFGLRGLPAVEHPAIVRLETAADWVAFLSSGDARRLAKERLPLGVSTHFQLRANTDRLDRFLSRVFRLERAASVFSRRRGGNGNSGAAGAGQPAGSSMTSTHRDALDL